MTSYSFPSAGVTLTFTEMLLRVALGPPSPENPASPVSATLLMIRLGQSHFDFPRVYPSNIGWRHWSTASHVGEAATESTCDNLDRSYYPFSAYSWAKVPAPAGSYGRTRRGVRKTVKSAAPQRRLATTLETGLGAFNK